MRWPRWLRFRLFEECPACGADARDHEVRTLSRERYAPGLSGVEAALAAGDFVAAARLDDPGVMGDLLVHQLVRCGPRVLLVTVEDPLTFWPRIRRTTRLDAAGAERAWAALRAASR